MYQVPSMHGIAKVVIDSATIRGDSEPLLIYSNSEKPASKAAPD
jgi:ATP-dependent Clp protease ATP-binding subunit ClpX